MKKTEREKDLSRLVTAIVAAWPDRERPFSSIDATLQATGRSDPTSRVELLEAILAARQSKLEGMPARLDPLLAYFAERVEALGCPDVKGLLDVVERFVFYHGPQGPGIKALGEMLAAVFAPPQDFAAGLFGPMVCWALSCPYATTVHRANGLAIWAGVRSTIATMLARALSQTDPADALFAARHIWYRAQGGEDFRGERPLLEEAIVEAEGNVAFFLSCALRLSLRAHGHAAPLPPLSPAGDAPPPDVEERREWSFFNSWRISSASSQFARLSSWPCPHEAHPGDRNKPCAVCGSLDTTCLNHEHWGCNSGRWELDELRCSDCGCYTLHLIDD